MSQRNSGFERLSSDAYATPAWVTEALIPHLPRKPALVFEPAAGTGAMVEVLQRYGEVLAADIDTGRDFLLTTRVPGGCDAIITNPPFSLAPAFIEHALTLLKPVYGFVALVLRTDFDHARSRYHLFGDCPMFCKKVALTRRIRWFVDSTGSPSFNHSWFIWDWQHQGPPTIAYSFL